MPSIQPNLQFIAVAMGEGVKAVVEEVEAAGEAGDRVGAPVVLAATVVGGRVLAQVARVLGRVAVAAPVGARVDQVAAFRAASCCCCLLPCHAVKLFLG